MVSQKNKAVALLKQQATALFILGHPVSTCHLNLKDDWLLPQSIDRSTDHKNVRVADHNFVLILFCSLGHAFVFMYQRQSIALTSYESKDEGKSEVGKEDSKNYHQWFPSVEYCE